jgi:hypothetical protein
VLELLPIPTPYDDIFEGMIDEIPAGAFYLKASETRPLSILPTKFFISTDSTLPVRIYNGTNLIRTHIPKGQIDVVDIPLGGPPGLNFLRAENGVDEPSRLIVVATHMAKHLWVYSAEIYEFAGYIVEKYNDLIHSVWSSFLVEYQMPWQDELPDVRSMRTLAVKGIAKCLYQEWGRQGGIEDLVAGFCSTTPVIAAPVNPRLWQPDLYQPQTSGQDITGFKIHVWLPNICLTQWAAFVRLMNNRTDYQFKEVNENKVTLQYGTTELYEQHLFNNVGEECSVRGLLDFIGCMDNIVVAGLAFILSRIALCAWATPFDMIVEPPGIGGSFFDSGLDFDGDFGDFDSIYDLDSFTDYWVGTSTVKHFDFGSCFDTYSVYVEKPENTDCCQEGPDTVLFTTVKTTSEVVSPVTPNNPVFGGDDPGLLYNPYLGILSS